LINVFINIPFVLYVDRFKKGWIKKHISFI
jgi:hypothetical protein